MGAVALGILMQGETLTGWPIIVTLSIAGSVALVNGYWAKESQEAKKEGNGILHQENLV